MKTRIWITGFEAFGSHQENPSQILVENLLDTHHEQHLSTSPPYGLESNVMQMEFRGQILTVDEGGSRSSLQQIADFDAVIHVGLNENTEKIRLEMCAINESDFRIPDNQGRMIQETLVEDSGLALLHTTAHRPSIAVAFENMMLLS